MIPPDFIPLKPPRRRKRRAMGAPLPPPLGLMITDVEITTVAQQLKVSFSGPIIWNGTDVPGEFKAFTTDGFFDSPINVIGVGADWMELEFNGAVLAGAAWELNGAMAGITPDVAWPQSGVVGA